MWNRNRSYLQTKKLCHELFAKSYLSEKKEANEIRCSQNNYLEISKLQKIFIFLDIFLANYIAPKCFSKMMYVSERTISLCNFQKFNKIKNHPAKPKILSNRKSPGRDNFLSKTRFLLKTFFLRQEFAEDKKSKNGKFALDKKKTNS